MHWMINPAITFPPDLLLNGPTTECIFSHPHYFLLPSVRASQDSGSALSPVFQIPTFPSYLLLLLLIDDSLGAPFFFLLCILLFSRGQPKFSSPHSFYCHTTRKYATLWNNLPYKGWWGINKDFMSKPDTEKWDTGVTIRRPVFFVCLFVYH